MSPRRTLPLTLALLGAAAATAQKGPLASSDPARLVELLRQDAASGGSYATSDIALVLLRQADPRVARAALGRLAARLDAAETKKLLAGLEAAGAAKLGLHPVAAERVGETRQELRRQAEVATAADTAAHGSIRALGFLDGNDVVLLLNRLAGDWAKPIQVAAQDALAIRQALGFQLETEYKKAPVGKSIAELAYKTEGAGAQTWTAWSGKGLQELELLKATLKVDPSRPWRDPTKKLTPDQLADEPPPLKVKPSEYQKKAVRDEKIRRRIWQIEREMNPKPE